MSEEMITIPKKEYEELKERDAWLCALEAAGVDNWGGCEMAQELREEWDEQKDK